jgi:hypothetical protein
MSKTAPIKPFNGKPASSLQGTDISPAQAYKMTNYNESLDEILTSFYKKTLRVDGNTPNARAEAKAELLQLVLEVIGNAPIATRGTTQNPTNEKYWTKATTVRQKLIDEQLKRAYKLFGKEQE